MAANDSIAVSRAATMAKIKPTSAWLRWIPRTLWGMLVGALVIFVAIPTIMVFPLALTAKDILTFPPQGYGLVHFQNVLSDQLWLQSALTTFQVALMAATIAAVFGTVVAVVVPPKGPVRLAIEIVVALPLVIPPVVLAMLWFTPFARADLIYSPLGVAIAHAFMGLPFVYLNVAGALSSLDPQLGQAARSLGARPWLVFSRITLPLVLPGVIAGFFLTLVLSIDELILAVFLGGGAVATIPVTMWAQIQYVTSPDIAAIAAVMTTLTIGTVLLALGIQLVLSKRRRVKA
jgi:putative spermidine/putrescine transport system permease protein